MDNSITKEKLQRFFNLCQYWGKLLERKQSIISTLGISGVHFSDVKVMSSNKKRTSEEERYAMALERINKELDSVAAELNADQTIIKNQLNRLTNPIYSKVIQLKYIEHWKTWEVIEDLFIGHPKWNPELNLEEFKKSPEYEYFRNEFYKIENRAIKQLEKVTGKSFIPAQNQLRIL